MTLKNTGSRHLRVCVLKRHFMEFVWTHAMKGQGEDMKGVCQILSAHALSTFKVGKVIFVSIFPVVQRCLETFLHTVSFPFLDLWWRGCPGKDSSLLPAQHLIGQGALSWELEKRTLHTCFMLPMNIFCDAFRFMCTLLHRLVAHQVEISFLFQLLHLKIIYTMSRLHILKGNVVSFVYVFVLITSFSWKTEKLQHP